MSCAEILFVIGKNNRTIEIHFQQLKMNFFLQKETYYWIFKGLVDSFFARAVPFTGFALKYRT